MSKPRTPRKHFGRTQANPRQTGLWGKDILVIDRMSQEGRGVAIRAGKIVFVNGALAGEHVRAQCTRVKRDYDEAEMTGLLADAPPSAQRVQPECPLYELCGGCSLQHWALPAQQQHKQANLLSMLQRIRPAFVLDTPITGHSSGFRHRLRVLVTRDMDRSYVLGLRQRRSHQSVSVRSCLVASAPVNELLQALPDMLRSAPDLPGLREIEIDADSNDRLGLGFNFAAHPGEKTIAALQTAMLGGSVVALRVRLITQRQAGSAAPSEESVNPWQELYAAGELCLRLAICAAPAPGELELAYLPGDFTQTHWAINAELVARAMDWLQPRRDETALDLFSGIGNFSLPLARFTKAVHAFEADDKMAERIAANAKRNGIENISAKALNLMAEDVVLPKADIAIVDPPRAGAKAVCEALARSRVKRLLYVSCHPATLLRDAKVLQDAGLRLASAATVDMFPHTGHSEAIALFERK